MKYCNPILKKALLLALFCPVYAQAQVPTTAAGYIFSAYSGTYTNLVGGTSAPNIQVDDANLLNIPIGFTFPFAGGTYTVASACSNGWLSLGNKNPTAAQGRTNNPANATLIGPMIMALWNDLNGSPSGQAFYLTTGTAPNRIFTFEWRNWKWIWTGINNNVISFQVKLYESGRIEVIYSEGPDPINATPAATIGIAKNGTDYQTLNNASSSPVSSSTAFTTNISTKPATGQVYAWDIPLPNNASMASIPAPTADICIGAHDVTAQIKNVGGNIINNVQINWSVNGVLQPPFMYNTPIAIGAISPVITIGSANFTNGIAPQDIVVWTSDPNGQPDPQPTGDTMSISRKALEPPQAVVLYTQTRACPGDSILIWAPTGTNLTYQWQMNADPIPGATGSSYYIKKDGFYSVKVFNPGCNTQSSFHKFDIAPLKVDLGVDTSLCEAAPPLILDADESGAGIQYLWSTGSVTKTIGVADEPGKYWVTVTLGPNCIASDTIDLDIFPLPKVNGITYVNQGSTYYFNPGGPQFVDNYLWNFGDGSTDTAMSPVHIFSTPGPHNVILKVFNSCGMKTANLELALGVNDLAGINGNVLLYPNPAQDRLEIKTNDNATLKEIKIYNSIGALVYRQTADTHKATIDVSSFANGNYSILILTSEGNAGKMFQVIK